MVDFVQRFLKQGGVVSTLQRRQAETLQRKEEEEKRIENERVQKRQNLMDFIEERRRVKEDTWRSIRDEIKPENYSTLPAEEEALDIQSVINEILEKHAPAPQEFVQRKALPTELSNVNFDGNDDDDDDVCLLVCHLCDEKNPSVGQTLPCRVCERTFHRQCIEKSKVYDDDDLEVFEERAGTVMGWSCKDCDDILELLTETEITTMMKEFERFSMKKDTIITMDMYLGLRRQIYFEIEGKPMPKYEVEYEKVRFRMMDTDSSGSIEYQEFMKNEACKMFTHRKKDELLRMLTPKEIQYAREKFRLFDTEKTGLVHVTDARRVFKSIYRQFHKSDEMSAEQNGLIPAPPGDSLELEAQVEKHTKLLMEADANNDGFVTWEEYLLQQALYLVCSRPNRANLCASREESTDEPSQPLAGPEAQALDEVTAAQKSSEVSSGKRAVSRSRRSRRLLRKRPVTSHVKSKDAMTDNLAPVPNNRSVTLIQFSSANLTSRKQNGGWLNSGGQRPQSAAGRRKRFPQGLSRSQSTGLRRLLEPNSPTLARRCLSRSQTSPSDLHAALSQTSILPNHTEDQLKVVDVSSKH